MARNSEILIENVKNYPILYDVSHKDYKNIRAKNKIWDELSQILGVSNGDTLKKQWKNLRDAYSKHLRSSKTSTGQAARQLDRYRTWPWVTQMSFLRPYLEFADTQSNVQRDAEEAGSSQSSVRANVEEANNSYTQSTADAISENGEETSEATDTSQQNTIPQQHVHSRRKRTHDQTQSQSQVDKVINFITQNREKEDATDLLFKSYAQQIKKMDMHRQVNVKFEIAKIMMQAGLEESDEIRSRSDINDYAQNNIQVVTMTEEPPDASSDITINESLYESEHWEPSVLQDHTYSRS